jgi:hypothetical protein
MMLSVSRPYSFTQPLFKEEEGLTQILGTGRMLLLAAQKQLTG